MSVVAEFRAVLKRLATERVPHVSRSEFDIARAWIRHQNDVPVLAAAVNAKPDWLLTANTSEGHFDLNVSARPGIRIASPGELLRIQFAAR
jgi:hypothetical protein